ncbi:MAG: DUF502 domain-containing protein [Campylobacteraceae bacterium]|jgi:uncharacterized membrane protein|nr:DUF502 domain-containing protein [Campylobacteraceae bacterium]
MKNKKNVFKHIIEHTLQGVFWLLPIVAVTVIMIWLYSKVGALVNAFFGVIGFEPERHIYLWMMLVVLVIVLLLYVIGLFMETKIADILQKVFSKIPGYSTIKDIVNVLNSSKKGDTKVLVVIIKGFGSTGCNIGLMYSQKESIIKDHYTVTLSSSPIPNGGFMFEVHKSNIYVIENATFDNNLQYLLAMGVKSMSEILKAEPKKIEEFLPLEEWLEKNRM